MNVEQVAAQNRRRLVGAGVIVLLTLMVVGLQWFRGRGQRDKALDAGWRLLAAAEKVQGFERQALVLQAQQRFARGTGVVSLEPLALVGVAVTEKLATSWGKAVVLPCALSVCTDDAVAGYARELLETAQVDAVVRFARLPENARRAVLLRELVWFAEGWATARGMPAGPGRGIDVRPPKETRQY